MNVATRLLEYSNVSASGCWEWMRNRHSHGYGRLRVNGIWLRAHRVSWETFRGPIGDGLHVLHTCDNPCCINPNHLFLGTAKENMADMVKKGRWRGSDRKGEKSATAKLTAEMVAEIRNDKRPQTQVAMKFGISRSAVGLIKQGKRWSHIPLPDPREARGA